MCLCVHIYVSMWVSVCLCLCVSMVCVCVCLCGYLCVCVSMVCDFVCRYLCMCVFVLVSVCVYVWVSYPTLTSQRGPGRFTRGRSDDGRCRFSSAWGRPFVKDEVRWVCGTVPLNSRVVERDFLKG